MNRTLVWLVGCLATGVGFVVYAEQPSAFKLAQTIPLPYVQGRIDHFAIDPKGQRLFMAALGNNTVEVLDLADGKHLRSLGDCSRPQGVAFAPGVNRLFIANGGSGVVNILDGTSFEVLKSLDNLPDADNLRYDAKADSVFVGYGDGALGVIRTPIGEMIATIPLAGHPESFQLEKNGNRIFVNVPDARHIAVVDRDKRAVIATWPMEEFRANFPMTLDEVNHRLLVGCRRPARLVVFDTANGKKVSDLEIGGDADDLFFDSSRKLIYISCGSGFLEVVEQRSADSYTLSERIPTVSGARTSFFSHERKEFYLAVPRRESHTAEIRVYRPH